jgi:hypothetical protein
VDVPRLPLDWPPHELGLALHAATALSYDPPSYAAGRFADELVKWINAIAAHRLEAMA